MIMFHVIINIVCWLKLKYIFRVYVNFQIKNQSKIKQLNLNLKLMLNSFSLTLSLSFTFSLSFWLSL